MNDRTAATSRMPLENGDGLYLAIIAVLFWLPLPLGSYTPLYSGVMACLLSGIFLTWCIGFLFNRYTVPANFTKHWPVLIVWSLWVCYLLLQITPLPITWVETLSPHSLDWHLRAKPDVTTATLSVNPYGTAEGVYTNP